MDNSRQLAHCRKVVQRIWWTLDAMSMSMAADRWGPAVAGGAAGLKSEKQPRAWGHWSWAVSYRQKGGAPASRRSPSVGWRWVGQRPFNVTSPACLWGLGQKRDGVLVERGGHYRSLRRRPLSAAGWCGLNLSLGGWIERGCFTFGFGWVVTSGFSALHPKS